MTYSVILPTLNEKNHIIQLIEKIAGIFQNVKKKFEIIVVDDNSSDGTIEILKKYEKTVDFLKILVREGKKKNLASSINEGIIEAQNEFVIWMDADFQHPPEYLENFIDYSKNYDAVICSRFLRDSKRYFNSDNSKKEDNENQSYFFNKLCKFFLYEDLTDFTSGFICLRKDIFNNYSLNGYYGDYFVSLIVHLKRNNKRIIEIPFKDELRASGLSKTMVSLNFKYLYTCLRYCLTLIFCIIKKK